MLKILDYLERIRHLEKENRELKRRLDAVENALKGTINRKNETLIEAIENSFICM